jgi:hypothetical protein
MADIKLLEREKNRQDKTEKEKPKRSGEKKRLVLQYGNHKLMTLPSLGSNLSEIRSSNSEKRASRHGESISNSSGTTGSDLGGSGGYAFMRESDSQASTNATSKSPTATSTNQATASKSTRALGGSGSTASKRMSVELKHSALSMSLSASQANKEKERKEEDAYLKYLTQLSSSR